VCAALVACASPSSHHTSTCAKTAAPADILGAMRTVPAGPFQMGCNAALDTACEPNEFPQHAVTLAAFEMMLTPVTVSQYRVCVDACACDPPQETEPWCKGSNAKYNQWLRAGHDAYPVNCVDFAQAEAFCAWADARLPSEAEWEKAARGGCEAGSAADCAKTTRVYPWGNEPATCARAILDEGSGWGCGEDRIWPVASRASNVSPHGLLDMAGNLWQWTADWYAPDAFVTSTTIDPKGPPDGVLRVIRGGTFLEKTAHLRSGVRATGEPHTAYRALGFRCARSVP